MRRPSSCWHCFCVAVWDEISRPHRSSCECFCCFGCHASAGTGKLQDIYITGMPTGENDIEWMNDRTNNSIDKILIQIGYINNICSIGSFLTIVARLLNFSNRILFHIKSIIYLSAPWTLSLKYCSPKHASVRKLINLIKYPGCDMTCAHCALAEENHCSLYWWPCTDKGIIMNRCQSGHVQTSKLHIT